MLSRSQTTLLAFLALAAFAQASQLDETSNVVIKRQVRDDAASVRTTDPTVISTTSSQPTVITDSSTTSVKSTTTEPSPSSTTTTPVPTPTESSTTISTSSSTIPSSSTESSTISSSSTVQSTTTSTTPKPPSTTPIRTPSPTVIRITQTQTVNGEIRTSVSESTSIIPATATDPASLNQSNETNGSGMSSKTRSTIIGVVVGLGGAALLGGLAVVAYRIWGRKKSRDDRDDDLMTYNRPDNALEKAGGSSGSGSTNPFKSTLENYHNPTKVNASSNF